MDHLALRRDRDSSALSFSTADWPEDERRGRICAVYGRNIMQIDAEPLPDCPLRIAGSFRALPGLHVAFITSSATRVRRTPAHLLNDDLIFNVSLTGGRTLHQRGRAAEIGDGEAVLTTDAEVSTTEISSSRFITFRMPRKPISALLTDLDDRIARPIRRDTQALRLLTGYAGALQDTDDAQPGLHHLAATHVYDLVALALGAARDVADVAGLRGAAAARLHAIKRDIVGNLGCPELSAASVAARQRVPLRYMQRLFESEGMTFTEFVLGERLARAHRMLRDPRFAARAINTIAFEAGFNNLSYFNRSFRARFGESPSDVRAQAQRDT